MRTMLVDDDTQPCTCDRDQDDHEITFADPGCKRHRIEADPDYDPTPWCHHCGAKKQKDCHCGPIAENN